MRDGRLSMIKHVNTEAAPFVDLTLGDWAVVAALVVAAVALAQFWRTVRQNRAGILLSMDARWNDKPMLEARAALNELMLEVDQAAKEQSRGEPPSRIKEKSEEIFAERLEKIHDDELDRYNKLKRICSFFEMAGYLARNRYIPRKDVINLFGGAILSAGRTFSHHIENLQSRPGDTGKVWEHMIWLVVETRKVAVKITEK